MKMTLGAFIAQLRKEKGLTQKQLSEILGVSDKTVSHWEREESAPDISILPLLAETLGVTVDELLKGEINPPATSVPQFIPTPVANKTTNSYRLFKIVNIISAVILLISTVITSGGVYLFRVITLDHTANYIAFFATLGTVLLSAGLAVIFNIVFTTRLSPESDSYNSYRFKANRISTLNIYLAIVCLSANLVFTGRYGFLFVAIALTLCLITEFALKGNILSIGKVFENERKKSVYLLRKSCTVLCAVLVITGSLGHFFVSDCWTPGTIDKVFDSAQEFKEYMETPVTKPKDTWMIETTSPPSTAPFSTQPPQSPVVTIIPNQNKDNEGTETIYDDNGNEVVTFIFRNKAVYKYSYNSDGKFFITTYDSVRKAETINHFRNHTIDFLMPLYYIAVIIISTIIYKKRLADLSN